LGGKRGGGSYSSEPEEGGGIKGKVELIEYLQVERGAGDPILKKG